MAGELGARRDRRDGLLDARLQVRDRLAGIGREPAVGHALAGHRGGPVAAADHPDVEVDGVGVVGEQRRGRDVELRLEAAQGLDHRVGGLDGVGAVGVGEAGVRGRAEHADLEPQHADLGGPDRVLRRLGEDRGVGRVPGQHARERAVAGALLLDHRLELDLCARGEAEALEAAHRADHRRQPRLHVARAAPVHPLAVDARVVGLPAPQRDGLRADHVDVPVEDQGAPVGGPGRLPVGEHVDLLGYVPAERRAGGMAFERGGVERHVERLEAERAEGAAHDLLAGRLLAEERRRGDERGQQFGHRGRLGRDRGEDLGVHGGDPTS